MIKMWDKISRYYPPWLEFIPVLLLVSVFTYTASHYSMLPQQIPTHFGLTGLPDDWGPKGFWSVYLAPVMGTAVWLSMALTNYFFIIKPDDPGKYINLPQRQKEKLGPGRLEAIRTTTARSMALINLTLVVLFAMLQYGSINTALGLQKGLGFIVNILGVILIIEAIGFTIKTISMIFTPKPGSRGQA